MTQHREIKLAALFVVIAAVVAPRSGPRPSHRPHDPTTPKAPREPKPEALGVGFTLLARYSTGLAEAAEMLSLSPDGMTLAFTNANQASVGVVDVSDAATPRPIADIDLSPAFGHRHTEPTSIDFTPNGMLMLVTAKDTRDPIQRADPGKLIFINTSNLRVSGVIDLGVGPDSVKVAPNGVVAAIAIEDEEDAGRPAQPQNRPGSVQVVRIDYKNPARSSVTTVPLNPDVGNNRSDPQPEYVDIDSQSTFALVSLQENNVVAVIDIASRPPRVMRYVDMGTALLHGTDVVDDGNIAATSTVLEGRREPDALCLLPDDQHFLTANEGDTGNRDFSRRQKSGSAGFTIFSLAGDVVFDSGTELAQLAILNGMYPDKRSDERSIELEACHITTIEGTDIAVVAAERSSFVAVYDISNVKAPRFMQILPAPRAPESVQSHPGRNLLFVGGEGVGGGGGIWVYRTVSTLAERERYPEGTFRAVNAPTTEIPFGGISGLAWSGSGDVFFAIPDADFSQSRVWQFRLTRRTQKLTLEREFLLQRKPGVPVEGYDTEALARNPEGGFVVVTEGRQHNGCRKKRCPEQHRNRLMFFDEAGVLDEQYRGGVVDLPVPGGDSSLAWNLIPSQGLASVAVVDRKPGAPGGLLVYAGFQVPMVEGLATTFEVRERLVRILRFDIDADSWSTFYYPLEKDHKTHVSDMVHLGHQNFAVIESDSLSAASARVKRVYRFSLATGSVNEARDPVDKELVTDLLRLGFRFDQAKIDGMASTGKTLVVVNDNDGGNSATFAVEIPL